MNNCNFCCFHWRKLLKMWLMFQKITSTTLDKVKEAYQIITNILKFKSISIIWEKSHFGEIYHTCITSLVSAIFNTYLLVCSTHAEFCTGQTLCDINIAHLFYSTAIHYHQFFRVVCLCFCVCLFVVTFLFTA